MKFFGAIILTVLLAFLSGLFLPWWGIAIAAFLVAVLIAQSAGRSFLSGLLAVFLLWFILSMWISSKNDGLLAGKIGELMGVGNNPFLLAIVTGLIGGLVAGFAAWAGSYLRMRQPNE